MDVETDDDIEELLFPDISSKLYSVTISPILYNKIDQHVLVVKKLIKPGESKQKWILEAIREKLAKEENSKEIPKEARMTIRIDSLTLKKLSERVDAIKQFRISYSKKQWILDAIEEKLERERESTSKKLAEYRATLKKYD